MTYSEYQFGAKTMLVSAGFFSLFVQYQIRPDT